MNLKDLVYTEGHRVVLLEIDDGDAVYVLMGGNPVENLLTFRVPKEDLRGAVFELTDTPKVFMRWIRKALEAREAERRMIEQARKDWDEGKQS